MDELPQLYSFIKGDLKLIGIRAKESKINSKYSSKFRNKLDFEIKHSLIDITYCLNKEKDLSQIESLEALYRLYLRNALKNLLKLIWNFFVVLEEIS